MLETSPLPPVACFSQPDKSQIFRCVFHYRDEDSDHALNQRVQKLLALGHDPNEVWVPGVGNALTHTVQHNYIETARTLLRARTNPYVFTDDSYYVLHGCAAIFEDNEDKFEDALAMAKMLVEEFGVDPRVYTDLEAVSVAQHFHNYALWYDVLPPIDDDSGLLGFMPQNNWEKTKWRKPYYKKLATYFEEQEIRFAKQPLPEYYHPG